jgi:hypothetical protein
MPSAGPSNGTVERPALGLLAVLALCSTMVVGCQPRVQLEAPKDPIVINLNVKIEQEVRVRVERELEDLLDDPELFGG